MVIRAIGCVRNGIWKAKNSKVPSSSMVALWYPDQSEAGMGAHAHLYLCRIKSVTQAYAFLQKQLQQKQQDSILTFAEKIQLARIKNPQVRLNYGLGRILLRSVLAKTLQAKPAELPLIRSATGKPELAEQQTSSPLHFNLSHSGTLLALAVSRYGVIGTDVENTNRRVPAETIIRRFFSAEEQCYFRNLSSAAARQQYFFTLWTVKEALLKMTGDGLSYGLHQFHVAIKSTKKTNAKNHAGKSMENIFTTHNPSAYDARIRQVRQHMQLLGHVPSGIHQAKLYGAVYHYLEDYIVTVFAQNIRRVVLLESDYQAESVRALPLPLQVVYMPH